MIVSIALLLAGAAGIGALYWFWRRTLDDAGPAVIATMASIGAIVFFVFVLGLLSDGDFY